jgi:hypothetical protein
MWVQTVQTKHSSHKVTNEMYIIKTKHKSSVNEIVFFKVECILWSQSLQVNNMKITFLIEICAHEISFVTLWEECFVKEVGCIPIFGR